MPWCWKMISKNQFDIFLKSRLFKCLISFVISLCFLGCASFASNKTACENADFLIPIPYSFLGNIFQISPCTSVESLRIETGIELKGLRSGVNEAVNSAASNQEFAKFAYKMGCQHEAHEKLLKALRDNRRDIFGENFEKTNIDIVKKIRVFTLQDSYLKKNCWP